MGTEIRAAQLLLNQHHAYFRPNDFSGNKLLVDHFAEISNKKMRNKITGLITHYLGRLQRGTTVKGIQLEKQIEEAQKSADAIPEITEYSTTPLPPNIGVLAMYNYYGHHRVVNMPANDPLKSPMHEFDRFRFVEFYLLG